MCLAIVIVHYHTPALAAEAVAALAADLAGAGLTADLVLVDNGSDAAGREILERLPVRRLDPGENLGYAGGVNLGVANAPAAEAIVLMNPDVLVLPGCLAALLAELAAGAEIAGPRAYWDRGRQLVLPPAEARSRRGELLHLLAGRGEGWAARARRRWRRHARRHWEAERPLPSHELSGSLLALRRSAWERVGPFDSGYRLFFEETDWLLRARRAGLPSRYVPAAQAIHLYNQSGALEPRSREWFEASAERFRKRHYGAWFPPVLRGLARLPASPSLRPPEPLAPGGGLDLGALGPFPLWIEVSPNPLGFPAAAHRVESAAEGRWQLPPEIAAQFPGGGLFVRVTDPHGRELLRRSLPGGLA
ncbi:MAG TPA: glycosyltransferase family 2 protein [Thermoanaerobaculia bacterium]|nr:glycosyltransferase family 2 protein [Thermoanaerobaculia bacterium]